MIFADVWKTAPFMALLLLAGLQVIPADLYDAAKVDGATALAAVRADHVAAAQAGDPGRADLQDAGRAADLRPARTCSPKASNGTTTLSLYSYQQLTQNRLIGRARRCRC